MNKPEISFVMPGIRKERWDAVYDSLAASTTKSFELVLVGPYSLTEKLQNLKNVKYVKDYGNPVRAQNIGTMFAEGNLLMWVSDDSIAFPGSIDKMIEILGPNPKDVVAAKYFEGPDNTYKPLQPDEYFKLNGSDCTSSKFIPDSWWIFNVILMYREFWDELGGLDVLYEACPMAYADFAVRAQQAGAKVVMSKTSVFNGDHMPGITGDHAPIHYAQDENDMPLFQKTYRNAQPFLNPNTTRDMMDWKKIESVWSRRFK